MGFSSTGLEGEEGKEEEEEGREEREEDEAVACWCFLEALWEGEILFLYKFCLLAILCFAEVA